MSAPTRGAAVNPFAAARFRPGALPWVGGALPAWVEKVLVPGARWQVLGPSGSGKTTLLFHLERAAQRAGWRVRLLRGSQGLGAGASPELWLVDEWQELSWLARTRLRATRAALVVSAHRDAGLPTLCELGVTPELARDVVQALADGYAVPVPELPDLAAALRRHAGNLREVLFELYDRVERNARGPAPVIDAAG